MLLSACASVDQTPYNPMAAKINVRLGLGYMQEGQIDRAREKLLRALDEAPDLADAQLAMGYFLLELHEIDQARPYYQKALKLAPDLPEVQNNYGVYLCRTGQPKASIEYFLSAASNPHYLHPESAYENAGVCALKIPDKRRAKGYFRKAHRYTHQTMQSLLEI